MIRTLSRALLAAALVALPAAAQPVLLQIRPRMGDTLRMRLDQRVETAGTAKMGDADSTMTMVTQLQVFTHAVALSGDGAGTVMQAVTDSILVSSTGLGSSKLGPYRRMSQGARLRLRVAPDGAIDVLDDPDGVAGQMRAVFSQMPTTLPRTPIEVGDTWLRTMVIPLTTGPGARGAGTLRAIFRLDSLSRSGDLAYLTVTGTIGRPDGAVEPDWGGQISEVAGSVAGTIIVDRRRGWMTDTRATITLRSLVTPPGGALGRPVRFKMTITQWLRALK